MLHLRTRNVPTVYSKFTYLNITLSVRGELIKTQCSTSTSTKKAEMIPISPRPLLFWTEQAGIEEGSLNGPGIGNIKSPIHFLYPLFCMNFVRFFVSLSLVLKAATETQNKPLLYSSLQQCDYSPVTATGDSHVCYVAANHNVRILCLSDIQYSESNMAARWNRETL